MAIYAGDGRSEFAVGGPFVHNQDWSRVNAAAWWAMAWAATLPVFASWSVWAWANGKVGAARPALFLVFVPVVSGIAAWLLLDEEVRMLQVVGVAIVVGALLTGRGRTGTGRGQRDLQRTRTTLVPTVSPASRSTKACGADSRSS